MSLLEERGDARAEAMTVGYKPTSPNQVLTHAARAAAKQLNKLLFRHLWWPRAKGSSQSNKPTRMPPR